MCKVFVRLGILLLAIGPIACSDANQGATQVAQAPAKPPEDLQKKMLEHQKKMLSARGGGPRSLRPSLRRVP
jgi:hypothetical protein